MVQLFGRSWTQRELLRHIGLVSQVGGVRLAELTEGNADGVRVAEFATGTGFGFTVLLDRGMDLAAAKGVAAALVLVAVAKALEQVVLAVWAAEPVAKAVVLH